MSTGKRRGGRDSRTPETETPRARVPQASRTALTVRRTAAEGGMREEGDAERLVVMEAPLFTPRAMAE
jgi:hypothetical protein